MDETVLDVTEAESEGAVILSSAVACAAALDSSAAAIDVSAATFRVSAATLADSSAILADAEAAVRATAARAGCAGGFLETHGRVEKY